MRAMPANARRVIRAPQPVADNALPRFLNSSRRAMIAACVSRVASGIADLSSAMDVSPEYTRCAARILDQAPDLADAVVSGCVSVRDAYAIRREPIAVRRKALDDVFAFREKTLVDAVRAAAAAARPVDRSVVLSSPALLAASKPR